MKELSDRDILTNSIRYALSNSRVSKDGVLVDFNKLNKQAQKFMVWLRDNYEPSKNVDLTMREMK